MKTCDFDPVKLIEYVTGEAADDVQKEIRAHLKECEACRIEVADLKSTRTVIREWKVPDMPVQWIFMPQKTTLFRRIREWLHMPGFAVPNWAIAASAAVILIFLSAAFLHTDIEISHEGFHLRTGLTGRLDTPVVEQVQPVLTEDLSVRDRRQDDIAGLIYSMLESRDNRLRTEYQVMMADVIKDLQSQREKDMERISSLVAEQKNDTDYRMHQTDALLKGLIMVSHGGR